MNELMVLLGPESWVYFRTPEKDADSALTKFFETLENAGVNTDNIKVCEYRLEEV